MTRENEGDAASNYKGVFEGRIGFGRKPAVIFVDFVEAYFAKESPLYAGVEKALDAALNLREAARAAGLLIIYTNVVYHSSLKDAGRFGQKVAPLASFAAGHPLGELSLIHI